MDVLNLRMDGHARQDGSVRASKQKRKRKHDMPAYPHMTFEPAKHEKEAWQETAGRYGFSPASACRLKELLCHYFICIIHQTVSEALQ